MCNWVFTPSLLEKAPPRVFVRVLFPSLCWQWQKFASSQIAIAACSFVPARFFALFRQRFVATNEAQNARSKVSPDGLSALILISRRCQLTQGWIARRRSPRHEAEHRDRVSEHCDVDNALTTTGRSAGGAAANRRLLYRQQFAHALHPYAPFNRFKCSDPYYCTIPK